MIAKGMDSLKKLEVWAAPFLLLCGAGLLAWAWSNLGSWTELLAERGEITRDTSSALLGAGLTSGVAFWGTLALNIPDFARYAKNQKEQIVGQALGLVPTMTAFAWIGAVVTNATVVILGTKVSDPVALVSQLGGPFLTVLAMVGLIIATLSTNLAANVVSPANDFSNLAPKKISFKTGALIAATVGMVMMPWKLYIDGANYLFTWLIGYGGMLGAVAGIMLTDYYLIRKCSLNVDALYVRGSEYEYSNGFNWIAVLALCLGISVNLPGFLGALGVIEVGDFARAIYERAWFAGVFISAFTYWAGMKFLLPAPLFNRDVSISNAD